MVVIPGYRVSSIQHRASAANVKKVSYKHRQNIVNLAPLSAQVISNALAKLNPLFKRYLGCNPSSGCCTNHFERSLKGF
jgi:hypothetical protein